MALVSGGQSARAQITAAPRPPFIGNGTTVVTTGTATDANSGGPFDDTSVSDVTGPATVTIGQTSGGALTLNNTFAGTGDEINLHSGGGATTIVTVLATATLNNSSSNQMPNTILIDGDGGTVDSGTVINSGTILMTSPTAGGNGIIIKGQGFVTNSGTIMARNGGLANDGVLFTHGGTVTNLDGGQITGDTNGVEIQAATGTVTNAGTITGGNGVTADTLILSNTGTISATATGVSATGADSMVTLQLGMISAGTNDVLLNGAASAVTITGRTLLQSGAANLLDSNNDGTLNLHLVGVTLAQESAILTKEAAAMAAPGTEQTITAGGETYSFQGFNAFTNNFVSFGQSVDPGLRDLGNKLDLIGLPNSAVYNVFYNAALTDPEAAVANLSGRVLTQGVNDLELNSRSGLISDLGNQFDAAIDSGSTGGVDLSHFSIGINQMLAFVDTSSQLDNLVNVANSRLGGTEMSDSKAMAPAVSPLAAPTWGVWASGTIQIADKDNSAGNTGFHALNGSPSVGVDYRINPDLRLGALFSYTTADADFNDGSRIASSTEMGGLYALYEHDGWRAHALAAGGASQYENTRATFGGNTSSSPDGTDVISDITGGYQFRLGPGGRLRVTPEAGVQYTHLQQDSFTESGPAAFAISRGSFDTDSLRTHVGFRSDYAFQMGPGLQFIPELRAAWYHECLDNTAGVNTSLTGAPALGSFTIRTFDPERDYALVGIGLNTAFTGYHGMPMGLFVNYDVQVGQDDFIQHDINFGIRADF